MRKQNSFTIAILFFLTSIMIFGSGCQSNKRDLIMKVYVPDNKPGVVLFDTESKKGQVLIDDKNSVFFVMQTSLTQEWAVVSKMPADPEEARGASEEKLLFYIPQKRIVYNPQYGKNAYLIGIEADGENEQVQWIVDNDKTVSSSLKELKEVCTKDSQACSATPSAQSSNPSQAVPDNAQQSTQAIDSFSIGNWLKPGVSQDVILSHLGEPQQKGEDQYWDATGTYVQEWRYPTEGLKINMDSDSANGKKSVRSIIITSPSKLKTPESVGIGTDYETVRKIYSDKISADESSEEMIVVGSIYGGMVFSFADGKVQQIFIGAGAE